MYSGIVEAAYTVTTIHGGIPQNDGDRTSLSYGNLVPSSYQDEPAQNLYMVSDREDTEGSISSPSTPTRNVPTGSKSKKSLKSIVDRLSRQSNVETANQPVIIDYSSSELPEFNAEPPGFNTQGLEYEQNCVQLEEQALDLSMKGPGMSSHVVTSSYENQTDTCGALDLSISKSKQHLSSHYGRDNESPEFVLDLTKSSPWHSPQNADVQSQFSTKEFPVSVQQADVFLQESNERGLQDFQANHLRVLQFLANHTIQRKVFGEEVDIDLLTCRYCRYSSTEKSCMMTHLTTSHVSKRRRGNGVSQRYTNSQGAENTTYLGMAPSSHRENSDYLNLEQKTVQSPHLALKSSQVSNGHSLSQPSGSGFSAKYSQLVELSPDVRTTLNQREVSDSSRQSTPIMLQGQSNPVKIRNDAAHIEHPTGHMTYIIGEGGLRSHPMYGSILQERLMSHNSNPSPTSSTGGDADTTQEMSVRASLSYTSGEKPRQFKLNHLCKKLAKRMDKQSLSQRNTAEQRGQSLTSDHSKSVSKRSQRDGVGQTRQDLITQTGTFSCSFCSKTFKRPLSLYGHLKQHSPLLKKYRKGSFQCENCPQSFPSLNGLFLHVQDNHVKDGEFPTQSNSHIDKTEGTNEDAKPVENEKPVGLSQEETHHKIEDGNRKRKKMKPYGLRQKARRDYLLDHDPMADYLNCEFPFDMQGTPSDVSNSHDGQNSVKERYEESKQGKRKEKVFDRRLQRKYRKVSEDVKVLLNLRVRHKLRKPNKWRRNHKFSSGIRWRKTCLKSKCKVLKFSLVSVRKYLPRRNGGHGESGFKCKLCGKAFRPLLEALNHFHGCHAAFILKKQSSLHSKVKLQGKPSHVEDDTVPKPAKAKNDLFVKIMEAGVEKFQCKLCLEIIQEIKLLARHFKMHKDIFEGSNRDVSSGDNGQNIQQNNSENSESVYVKNASPQRDGAEKKVSGRMKVSNHLGSSKLEYDVSRQWNGLVNQQGETFPFSRKESVVKNNNYDGLTAREISPKQGNQSVRRVGSSSRDKHQIGAVFQGKDHSVRYQLANAKGIQKFVCTVCSFGTVYAEQVTKHMRKHCKAGFECDQCQYQTVEKRFIIRHVQTVHEQQRPYTCELCVYSTACKHHLKRHYRSHSVDLLTCAKCSFCTLQEAKLQDHMMQHDMSPATDTCEECNVTFSNSKLLEEHLADVHNKSINSETPPPNQENDMESVSPPAEINEAKFEKYSCNACQFSSGKSSVLLSHMLKEHMRAETINSEVTLPTLDDNCPQEENSPGTYLSVQCPQCGFITSHDQLDAHLETHNGDETYACEHCPFETKSLDSLQRHKGKHSKNKVSLTCLQCNQVQTDTLSLRDHMRIHLNSISKSNIFRCSLCAFTTHSPQEGEHHLDQHNYVMEYKCQICMYSSPSLSGLTSHRKLHRKIKPTTHTQKRSSPSKRPFKDSCTNDGGK